MAVFRHSTDVMFQHCDPAGIVFYPRYFEMINEVVERFFGEAVGWSFRQMHTVERVGIPMGRIATDFHAASRLGDQLDWTLTTGRIGGASLDVTVAATCDGQARLTAQGTLVLVDLDRMKSIRWPDERRATLETYKED
ncbi:acyl-CoA thioesterase [Palleronia abyssalis]|uniref:1,4-dihydroxy-2-naphthoyl-CoA hydrolase n=1 Tax=Palleronia abyssalis TaxID=1501240 RepID=A0A2R8C0V1_9RHOB|nr:thioesterase family protein [Palleronia abyssalis]SPJ26020.1 1,4-dihydroxy-2-naphthoyl-CoA hydrolase [Palleronia abyssalis]